MKTDRSAVGTQARIASVGAAERVIPPLRKGGQGGSLGMVITLQLQTGYPRIRTRCSVTLLQVPDVSRGQRENRRGKRDLKSDATPP